MYLQEKENICFKKTNFEKYILGMANHCRALVQIQKRALVMTNPVFNGLNGVHGHLVLFPVEKEVKNLDTGNAKVWTHLKFIIIQQVLELLVCYFLVVMGSQKIIEVVNRDLANL